MCGSPVGGWLHLHAQLWCLLSAVIHLVARGFPGMQAWEVAAARGSTARMAPELFLGASGWGLFPLLTELCLPTRSLNLQVTFPSP